MSGTIFFICLTLAISALSAAPRIFSVTSCTRTMAKRMQEDEGDNRIVAKSKPTTMNLTVSVSTSSSTVNSPIASKSRGYSKHPVFQIGQVLGNLTQEIAIKTQRRVLKGGNKILSRQKTLSKHFVEQIGKVQGNLTQEIPITSQCRFSQGWQIYAAVHLGKRLHGKSALEIFETVISND